MTINVREHANLLDEYGALDYIDLVQRLGWSSDKINLSGSLDKIVGEAHWSRFAHSERLKVTIRHLKPSTIEYSIDTGFGSVSAEFTEELKIYADVDYATDSGCRISGEELDELYEKLQLVRKANGLCHEN